MGMIANAGGTAPKGCDPAAKTLDRICHHQITPDARTTTEIAQDILAAFAEVRSVATITCRFALHDDAKRLDAARTRVTATVGQDMRLIPHDPVDGWDFDAQAAPSRIVLHGESCRYVTETSDVVVDVEPGCR
jgi:hypothetical protein